MTEEELADIESRAIEQPRGPWKWMIDARRDALALIDEVRRLWAITESADNRHLHLPLPETHHAGSCLYGTGVLCVGCGADQGVTTVAIPESYIPPDVTYPYDEGACPVCALRDAIDQYQAPSWPRGKPRPLP